MNDSIHSNMNMLEHNGVHCYVLRCISGDVLIDTGTRALRDAVETWLCNYDIKLIVLTNGSPSHTANAKYFSELYNAPILMSEADIPLIKGQRSVYRTGGILKSTINALAEEQLSAEDYFLPDLYAENGKQLCDYGIDDVLMTSQIILLDGVTKGNIGIIDGDDLYCGDAISVGGMYSGWPPFCESPKAAKHSLERVSELMPKRIFPTNGRPLANDEKAYAELINKFSK